MDIIGQSLFPQSITSWPSDITILMCLSNFFGWSCESHTLVLFFLVSFLELIVDAHILLHNDEDLV